MEESDSQSSAKESSNAKEFKGWDGRLGSESGGKTNVTNVHASFSPPAHNNPASGFGMGMETGIWTGVGTGMRPDIREDSSVVGGDSTDQAPALDQDSALDKDSGIGSRFRQFVGISATLTAQWKNDNILGQFEVSFIFGSGFILNQRPLTSFK